MSPLSSAAGIPAQYQHQVPRDSYLSLLPSDLLDLAFLHLKNPGTFNLVLATAPDIQFLKERMHKVFGSERYRQIQVKESAGRPRTLEEEILHDQWREFIKGSWDRRN